MRLGTIAGLALGLATLSAVPAARADVHIRVPRPHVYVTPQPVTPYYGGQYSYQQPYGGGPRWQDPNFFSFHMRDRMNDIERDLHDRVNQGIDSPQVFGEFHSRRADIERDIQQAGADGVITPGERDHIRADVDSLRTLEDRYRINNETNYPRDWER